MPSTKAKLPKFKVRKPQLPEELKQSPYKDGTSFEQQLKTPKFMSSKRPSTYVTTDRKEIDVVTYANADLEEN